MTTFGHILVAFDDSKPAERALRIAIDLAVQLKSRLTLATVIEPLPGYVALAAVTDPSMPETLRRVKREEVERLQSKACELAKERGLMAATLLVDNAEVSGLLHAIRLTKPDLLIIGRRAHAYSLELAGTVRGVVNETTCPVLAVA